MEAVKDQLTGVQKVSEYTKEFPGGAVCARIDCATSRVEFAFGNLVLSGDEMRDFLRAVKTTGEHVGFKVMW